MEAFLIYNEIMKQTILIVDDDQYIGNMVELFLKKEGYDVLRSYSGTETLLLLKTSKPDLILLDLMLPGLSGEELLPQIKQVPTIIVSAKEDIQSKIYLLRAGAVDYVTKPFNLEELLLRIQIALRANVGTNNSRLVCGKIEIDLESNLAYYDEKQLHLTRTELAILKVLMDHKERVLSKTVIMQLIEDQTPDCVESSLKVHVSNLRKKLRDAGAPDLIESVWGIGFKLNLN